MDHERNLGGGEKGEGVKWLDTMLFPIKIYRYIYKPKKSTLGGSPSVSGIFVISKV